MAKSDANLEKVRSALAVAVDAIGGKARPGQIEMAEAVANALSDRHHLLVQAGRELGSRWHIWSQQLCMERKS